MVAALHHAFCPLRFSRTSCAIHPSTIHPGCVSKSGRVGGEAEIQEPSDWRWRFEVRSGPGRVICPRYSSEHQFRYVLILQRLYGDALLVFFDSYGGIVIGCVWNPAKDQSRNLKPFIGFSTRPMATEVRVLKWCDVTADGPSRHW